MVRVVFALITAVLAASSNLVAAKDRSPLRLAPSSQWQMNYADDSCRLMRTFGEGNQRTFVYFERYAPGDQFQFLIAGKPIETRAMGDGHPIQATVQFGPTEKAQELWGRPGTISDLPSLVFTSAALAPRPDNPLQAMLTPSIGAAREKAITTMSFATRGRDPVELDMGAMDKPMAAMRTCTDELLTHWGIDVARHANATRLPTPTGSPGEWVRSSDYPPSMSSQGKQAIVAIRLTVEDDGRPSACSVQRSNRDKAFDEATCKALMRRARFEPALDAGGQPMKSFYQNTVAFQMAR